MDLRQATSVLLRDPEVARWLKLADTHILAYNRMPEQFILPADHALLQPIIETFASDTNAFAQYIKALRDASDGLAYDELHDLYRTVSLRALQTVRRARLRKAVVALIPRLNAALQRQTTADEHVRVVRFVEQCWGAMRLASMAEERRLRKTNRLSSEDRTFLLDRFWAGIDKQLDNGVVPLGRDDAFTELVEMLSR